MSWGNSGWGNSGWGNSSWSNSSSGSGPGTPTTPTDDHVDIWGHSKEDKKWGHGGWGNPEHEDFDKHDHYKSWGYGWSERHNNFEKHDGMGSGHAQASSHLGSILASVFGLKSGKKS